MRITEKDREMIRQVTKEVTNGHGIAYVFGSRLDDDAKGGDWDIFVSVDEPVDNSPWTIAQLVSRISRNAFGRKVDVVLSAPNLKTLAIHEVAARDGVLV